MSSGPWVEQWLSVPRFGVYLQAVRGDRQRALDLYEWNTTTAAAFLHDLAHLEVGLRNAYDVALSAPMSSGHPHWTLDATRYFPTSWRKAADGTRVDINATPRKQIAAAVRTAGAGAPSGKIIAELMFGFWRYLSSAAHDVPLWRPYLHHAFPPGTDRRQVDRHARNLHKLRNRAVHHEPLLHRDRATGVLDLSLGHLAATHDSLLDLAGLLSPELRGHIATHSHCRSEFNQRP